MTAKAADVERDLDTLIAESGDEPLTLANFGPTLNMLVEQIAAAHREIAKLKKQTKALGDRPASLKYCGVWDSARGYGQDDACTHAGGLWISKAGANYATPGTDANWQLAVKRGRDGRGR